jgi:hypothetical protein
MATYVIQNDTITAYEEAPAGIGGVRTYQEFALASQDWTGARLVTLYNNLASAQGATSVNKFMNRDAGRKRLWALLQKLPISTPPQPASTASKKDTILGMVQQTQGATLEELMAATGWQAHSVRGFLSVQRGEYQIDRITRTDNAKAYYAVKRTHDEV